MFVEMIEPVKSGASLLDVNSVMALRPFVAHQVRARLLVHSRSPSALVALWQEPGAAACLIAITEIDHGWIEQHCQWITDTHVFLPVFSADEPITPQGYLARVFGATPETILVGAAAASGDWPEIMSKPKRAATVAMELRCVGMPAYLLLKGTIPSWEDKWFIYRDGDRVVFQRCGTGIKVWEAVVVVTTDAVTVNALTGNLDRRQYSFGSPDVEISRFERCVTSVLWRRETWGYEPEVASARTAAEAWRRLLPARRPLL